MADTPYAGAAGDALHVVRLPACAPLLLLPVKQAQRLSASLLSFYGYDHSRIHRLVVANGQKRRYESLCMSDWCLGIDAHGGLCLRENGTGARHHLPWQAC